MNVAKKDNLPFGIHIAAKVVASALQEGVAPPSIVLQNLFILQKMELFPENLDTQWFSTRKINQPLEFSIQKKIIFIMEELKKPSVDKQKFLEKQLLDGWNKKKLPKPPLAVKKTFSSNKPKFAAKKAAGPAPVVIIKKNKKLV